jgi:PAS domain S-box-containing protein
MNANTNYTYSLLLLIAGAISLATMQVAWKRRHVVPYATPLAIFSLGTALWALPYAVHWADLFRFSEFFWVDMTYFGVIIVPTAFLAFALSYTDKAHWLSKRTILLLTIVPLLTLVFLWTDPMFGVFFAGKRSGAVAVIIEGGIWFWFQLAYSYSLIAYGMLLMFRAFLRFPQTYRGQIGMMIIGCLIPVALSAIGIFGTSPIPNLDLTPISFTLTGVFISVAVFRFGFLDLRPIAYEILFANLSDAVIVVDEKDRIIELNPRADDIIGDMLNSPIGRRIEELQALIPEIPSDYYKIQEGQIEFSIFGPPTRHFEVTISPLVDRSKVFRGRILTLRDITERKKAAIALEQANEEIKQFAYIVSHDLRAPLVNLKGFSSELRIALDEIQSAVSAALPHMDGEQRRSLSLALDEDVPEALSFIESSVTRMDGLINAVLRLSRLGRRELDLEPLDMEALVQVTLETLAHQIEERQGKVTVGSLPEVVADRTSMEQIMGNLLGNAVKYLDPDRPAELEITAEHGLDETTFRVRDNGRGIAEDDMDKVFAPFRRIGRQDMPGEGMGLPYVQALVRRHGGRIWCESKLGVGTTLSFTISAPPPPQR